MALMGALGGLVGWMITEPFAPKNLPILFPQDIQSLESIGGGHSFALMRNWSMWEIWFSLSIGAFIGLALGSVSGYLQGSRTHFLRGALGGFVLGAIGGFIGLRLSEAFVNMWFPADIFTKVDLKPYEIPQRIFARVLVFIPFGALIGFVYGIGSLSLRRAFQGMIGGAIGGAVGGASFDFLGSIFGTLILAMRGEVYGEVGLVSRAVASVCTGGAIGLFVGIVERISRKAWVRLELGRNEGKEWIIDAPQTFIGRSENAHIPLFGDPNLAPMHACIVRQNGLYRIVDGGAPIGIGVNGIRVKEAVLNHGDVINIGSFHLRFLMKNIPANVRPTVPQTVDYSIDSSVQQPSQPASTPTISTPTVSTPTISTPTISTPTLSSPPSQFFLLALDGPLSGKRFPIGPGETIAGREAVGVNLSFDPSASRRHASFMPLPDGVLVRDTNSTNGTFVNGVKIHEMTMRRGDTVKIGMTTFRLE